VTSRRASGARSHEGNVEPALAVVVVPSPTLDPAARVGIYQGMYVWRLCDVLHEDFPKLAEAAGGRLPGARTPLLSRRIRRRCPSVREFGRHLPDFSARRSARGRRGPGCRTWHGSSWRA
jgi:hypothetical protein